MELECVDLIHDLAEEGLALVGVKGLSYVVRHVDVGLACEVSGYTWLVALMAVDQYTLVGYVSVCVGQWIVCCVFGN